MNEASARVLVVARRRGARVPAWVWQLPVVAVLLLALLLVTWGYGRVGGGDPYGHTPITVAVVDFPHASSHSAALVSAFAYWGSGTELGWSAKFVVVDESQPHDITVTFDPTATVPCGFGPLTVQGAGCGGFAVGHGVARVATDASDAAVVQVTTHELGHALGLAHSSDKRSVMYASVDGLPWWAWAANYPFGQWHTGA